MSYPPEYANSKHLWGGDWTVKPTVYVIGPYSKGEPGRNTIQALHVADRIAARGGVPFVPHLSHFWDMVHPHPYEWWMGYVMVWLEKCDLVFRIPGESPGGDKEEARVEEMGKRVIKDWDELDREIDYYLAHPPDIPH